VRWTGARTEGLQAERLTTDDPARLLLERCRLTPGGSDRAPTHPERSPRSGSCLGAGPAEGPFSRCPSSERDRHEPELAPDRPAPRDSTPLSYLACYWFRPTLAIGPPRLPATVLLCTVWALQREVHPRPVGEHPTALAFRRVARLVPSLALEDGRHHFTVDVHLDEGERSRSAAGDDGPTDHAHVGVPRPAH
jgi:hypothetical protein